VTNKNPVSVIIVNFNGGELLARSVSKVFASDIPVKVIVVDNASADNSIQLLEHEFGNDPRLTIIRNSSNLGFSSANNIAIRQAEGNFILFLNPDCLIKPDTISHLLQTFRDNDQTGMLGCRKKVAGVEYRPPGEPSYGFLVYLISQDLPSGCRALICPVSHCQKWQFLLMQYRVL